MSETIVIEGGFTLSKSNTENIDNEILRETKREIGEKLIDKILTLQGNKHMRVSVVLDRNEIFSGEVYVTLACYLAYPNGGEQ